MVTVELAGPSWKENSKTLFSIQLRNLVSDVIEACVDRTTWGGFATYDLQRTGDGLHEANKGGFGKSSLHSFPFLGLG